MGWIGAGVRGRVDTWGIHGLCTSLHHTAMNTHTQVTQACQQIIDTSSTLSLTRLLCLSLSPLLSSPPPSSTPLHLPTPPPPPPPPPPLPLLVPPSSLTPPTSPPHPLPPLLHLLPPPHPPLLPLPLPHLLPPATLLHPLHLTRRHPFHDATQVLMGPPSLPRRDSDKVWQGRGAASLSSLRHHLLQGHLH